MNYLKYTPYIYLFATILFLVKAVETWNENNDKHFLFLGLAIFGLFSFFFRRRFATKFQNRSNKS